MYTPNVSGTRPPYSPHHSQPPADETAKTAIRVAGYAIAAFAFISLATPSNIIFASLIIVATELSQDNFPWIFGLFDRTPRQTPFQVHSYISTDNPFDEYVPPSTSTRFPQGTHRADRREAVGTESPEPQWQEMSPLTQRRNSPQTSFTVSTPRHDREDRRESVGKETPAQLFWQSDDSVQTPSIIQVTPHGRVDRREPVGSETSSADPTWNVWQRSASGARGSAQPERQSSGSWGATTSFTRGETASTETSPANPTRNMPEHRSVDRRDAVGPQTPQAGSPWSYFFSPSTSEVDYEREDVGQG